MKNGLITKVENLKHNVVSENIMYNFIIFSIIFLLFNYFIIAFGNEINLSKFIDPSHRFNFFYPSDWKKQYQNNNEILFFPSNTTKYNNTFIEIKGSLLYNMSLKDHVFRDLNHYISKYIVGDFLSFRINNIESNLTIDKSPTYKTEYRVIINDKFQSPVSIIQYYTTNGNFLYKLKFSEDGYATDLLNKNITKRIIDSFSFDTAKMALLS